MKIERVTFITTLCKHYHDFIGSVEAIDIKDKEIIFISDEIKHVADLVSLQNSYKTKGLLITPIFYQYSFPNTVTIQLAHLAKYRWLLIWNFLDVPKPVDLENLLDNAGDGRVAGLYGGVINPHSLTSTEMYHDSGQTGDVDFLTRDCLLIEKNLLWATNKSIQINSRFESDLKISTTLRANGIEMVAAPCSTSYRRSSEIWSDEDSKDFSYQIVNPSFISKKWDEINAKVLPYISRGSHFLSLDQRKTFTITVFGCQRSGTTWINSLVGDCFSNTVSFTENQSFDFLLGGLKLSQDFAEKVISLQTTFMISERESYISSSSNLIKVFVLRNPLSVCWSLMYHFKALDAVFRYRRKRFSSLVRNICSEAPTDLEKAISLYQDGLETANQLMDKQLILVSYERFVEDAYSSITVLHDLVAKRSKGRCGAIINTATSIEASVDDSPLTKFIQLSVSEKETILDKCEDQYLKIKRLCINEPNY